MGRTSCTKKYNVDKEILYMSVCMCNSILFKVLHLKEVRFRGQADIQEYGSGGAYSLRP